MRERSMMDFNWSDDDQQVWTAIISDRKVSRSLGWKMAACWNCCKDERTGGDMMVLPIIMNDEKYDYCSKCCTAWLVSKSIEGEFEDE